MFLFFKLFLTFEECRVELTVDMIGNEVEVDRQKENLEMCPSNLPVVEIEAEIREISKLHQHQKIKSHKSYR